MTTLVLSLTQPWATLVAIGAKKIETRSWATKYRGPMAIHASAGFPKPCRDICSDPPFQQFLRLAGFDSWEQLPRGQLLAVVNLVDCVRVETIQFQPYDAEPDFGDYSPGRFGWITNNLRRLKPIPAKGRLGLWTFERDLVPEDFA